MQEEKQTDDMRQENGGDPSLEELFAELDDILREMDEPDVSLEDSFSLYEKGMKKVRLCNDKLDTVEKKMLKIAQDGSEEPFED